MPRPPPHSLSPAAMPAAPPLRKPLASVAVLAAAAVGCAAAAWAFSPAPPAGEQAKTAADLPPAGSPEAEKLRTAVFAGGCFWCMEPPFDKLPGVKATTSGYTGGRTENPSYGEVSAGGTGHTEALKVTFDPAQVSYETLLEVFWRNHDPLTGDAQFCDRGTQYRPGIYFAGPEQEAAAKASLETYRARFDRPVLTEVEPAGPFYDAEGYHQDYYLTNPLKYKYYRYGCGRDARLKEVWGEEAGAPQIIAAAKAEAAAGATPDAG